MVNEAQGPGGAVQARVQAVIQVGQALPLPLSAVGVLQLRAAVGERRDQVSLELSWLAHVSSLGSSVKGGS